MVSKYTKIYDIRPILSIIVVQAQLTDLLNVVTITFISERMTNLTLATDGPVYMYSYIITS